MSLYPSLETMAMAQRESASVPSAPYPTPRTSSYPLAPTAPITYGYGGVSAQPAPNNEGTTCYPQLQYMDLEITPEMMREMGIGNELIPAYSNDIMPATQPNQMVIPTQYVGLRRAYVTNGIRELMLCKDKDNKIGLRVKAINSGIFVCLVIKDSPAALAGLRFGDQILQINGTDMAGLTMEEVHNILKKCPNNGIRVAVRDRPFERTVTLHKDVTKHVGFQFKNGKIVSLVKDSSAARNGVLTNHYILEVEGKNVVGSKDKEISKVIDDAGDVVTITIIPECIYDHMVAKMSSSLFKIMDHSVPTI